MSAYYNERDAYPAQWIRNLASVGLVASGTVDERSIRELKGSDVAGSTQFHAFAGLAVWSYALRLAGWPDDAPVWTGSCPCQPFSAAGKRAGFDDERHLWPEWFRLIRECRPAIVLGEQVASPDGLAWLDAVRADMEGEGYAFGASDLCAAGVGAPHIRQRLYFCGVGLADTDVQRREGLAVRLRRRRPLAPGAETAWSSDADGVADADEFTGGQGGAVARGSGSRSDAESRTGPRGNGGSCGMVHSDDSRPQGRIVSRHSADERAPWPAGVDYSACDWIYCRDGKHRPVEPGTRPLAHGAAARVGRLRAYGNAIHASVAATFVRAVMDSL